MLALFLEQNQKAREDQKKISGRIDQMNVRLQGLEKHQQRPARNPGLQEEKFDERGEPATEFRGQEITPPEQQA